MPRRTLIVAAICGLTLGCTVPPLKEYHQAQGALDAARAAGAEHYAADEYQAALEALKHYDAAVAQRDYRLALNHALDAFDRAQDAAKTAANQKALIRSEAESVLADASRGLVEANQVLKKATDARVPRSKLAGARRSLRSVETKVQEARKALEGEDYLKAREMAKGLGQEARAAVAGIRAALPPQPGRQRR